ncbi:hypothetical protein CPB85DRAFT_1564827 [Mucidula mucida]|nr:hypothetical protein CPB85DRAFT_1564827 [Mucidula mucida]
MARRSVWQPLRDLDNPKLQPCGFLDAILACRTIYWYLVMNYSNPEALGVSIWSANVCLSSILVYIITDSIGEADLARVGFHHTHCPSLLCLESEDVKRRSLAYSSAHCNHCTCIFRRVLSFSVRLALISTLSFVAFVLATVGMSFKAGTFADYPEPDIEVVSSTSLALSVLADIMIAVSIGYYLNRGRSGFSKTDHLINKLIFYALNVGILTSILDFAVLITSEVDDSLIFLAIFEVVGSVYFNSLLAMLNIRAITRGQVLNEDGTSLELHSTNFKTTVEFKAGTDGSQSGIETPKKRSRTTLFGRSMQSKTMIHTEVHELSHDQVSEFEAAPSTEHQVAHELKEIVYSSQPLVSASTSCLTPGPVPGSASGSSRPKLNPNDIAVRTTAPRKKKQKEKMTPEEIHQRDASLFEAEAAARQKEIEDRLRTARAQNH